MGKIFLFIVAIPLILCVIMAINDCQMKRAIRKSKEEKVTEVKKRIQEMSKIPRIMELVDYIVNNINIYQLSMRSIKIEESRALIQFYYIPPKNYSLNNDRFSIQKKEEARPPRDAVKISFESYDLKLGLGADLTAFSYLILSRCPYLEYGRYTINKTLFTSRNFEDVMFKPVYDVDGDPHGLIFEKNFKISYYLKYPNTLYKDKSRDEF